MPVILALWKVKAKMTRILSRDNLSHITIPVR